MVNTHGVRLTQKGKLNLLETEKNRLHSMIAEVKKGIRFSWGIYICPVCALAIRLNDGNKMRKCNICIWTNTKERCVYIDGDINDVIVWEDSTEETAYTDGTKKYLISLFENYIRQILEEIVALE